MAEEEEIRVESAMLAMTAFLSLELSFLRLEFEDLLLARIS